MNKKMLKILKDENITISILPEGKIRCVKAYIFPDGVTRLIYKNFNIEFKNMSALKFCLNEFIKFYNKTVEEIKEEGFNLEDLT